jgi:predicted component of type VI protein secretion system
MPRMIVRRQDGLERRVAFESDLRIGRDEENELVLEDPERGVSRFHAEIRRGSPHWSIVDLGSRNGTTVDGIAIDGPTPLPPGALVGIGSFTLELLEEGARTWVGTQRSPDQAPTIFSPVNSAKAAGVSSPHIPSGAPARVRSYSANERRAWLFIATALVVLFIIGVLL